MTRTPAARIALPILGLAALAILAHGCDEASPAGPGEPALYTLTVEITGIGEGRVLSSPTGIDCETGDGSCTAQFEDGTAVTLTATPAEGSVLVEWTGAGSGTTTRQVTTDADRAVTAEFDRPMLAVATIGSQGGTITSRDGILTLSFPAGALASEQAITIEIIGADDLDPQFEEVVDSLGAGTAYRLGPAGLQFGQTVEVSIATGELAVVTDSSTEMPVRFALVSTDSTPVGISNLTLAMDDDSRAVLSGGIDHFSFLWLSPADERRVVIGWSAAPETWLVGADPFTVLARFSIWGKVYIPDNGLSFEDASDSPIELDSVGEIIKVEEFPDIHRVRRPLHFRCAAVGNGAVAGTVRGRWTEGITGWLAIDYTAAFPGRQPVACEEPAARVHAVPALLTNVEGIRFFYNVADPPGGGSSLVGLRSAGAATASNLEPCPPLIIAGQNGALVMDPCTGETVRQYTFSNEPRTFFDAIALPRPEGHDGTQHTLVYSGIRFRFCALDNDGNRSNTCLAVGGSPVYTDANELGGDPSNGAVLVNNTTRRLDFLLFNPDAGTQHGGPFEGHIGLVQSAALPPNVQSVATNAAGDRILAIGSDPGEPGELWYIDRTGGTPESQVIGELQGTNPRRIRCDLEAGICAASDFAGSLINIILWDGEGAPTIAGATEPGALADGPVGLDIFGHRIVSAGFNDDHFSIVTVDAAGAVTGVTTTALPEGCQQPGHALFLRDALNTIVATCWGSGALAVVPDTF